jgi:ankyrin repeat protein
MQNAKRKQRLVRAAGNGYKEILPVLIRRGAETNESTRPSGNALQAAAGNGHKVAVQILLEDGAERRLRRYRTACALRDGERGGREAVT